MAAGVMLQVGRGLWELAARCLLLLRQPSASPPAVPPCISLRLCLISLLTYLHTEPCLTKKQEYMIIIIAYPLLLLSEIHVDLDRDRHRDKHCIIRAGLLSLEFYHHISIT